MVARILVVAVLALLCGACDGGAEGTATEPFQCIGLSTETCERMLTEARQEYPGVPVVRAVIRCTIAVCTEAQGEAWIRVDFANGRFVDVGQAWMQADPAPLPAITQPPGSRPTFAP